MYTYIHLLSHIHTFDTSIFKHTHIHHLSYTLSFKIGSEIATISGIITEKTHFIFRSRSTRIIWLVQISKEMYEVDETCELYFEKFLHKFVEPLIDQWKALGVSHLLSVIFFARTLFPMNSSTSTGGNSTSTGVYSSSSQVPHYAKTRDGIPYRDFFQVNTSLYTCMSK